MVPPSDIYWLLQLLSKPSSSVEAVPFNVTSTAGESLQKMSIKGQVRGRGHYAITGGVRPGHKLIGERYQSPPTPRQHREMAEIAQR
ncbi:hypothetical protein J6590_013247 [Homalodisca vitripennis]|nr:hypothetical protein J6590_013247 [Homalodisca vitripennis]